MKMLKSRSEIGVSVGEDAHDAYRKIILAQPDIETLEIYRYSSPPSLQARVSLNEREQVVLDLALRKRTEEAVPFWHAVFSSFLEAGWCSPEIVQAALLHNGPGAVTEIAVSQLNGHKLDEFFRCDERNVGLSSRLTKKDGTAMHMAMLDFRCDVEPASECVINTICEGLYSGGFVVVESGHSYHACGYDLLANHERIDFLARALVFSPVIDTAYLAHQIRQPFSTIRISRGGSSDRLPKVVLASEGRLALSPELAIHY